MSHRTNNLQILSFLLLSVFAKLLVAHISFQSLTNRSYFVDKTGLIEEFFKTNKPYLMTCATRKFGKSVNLDMVRQFVQMEINETTGIPLNKTESSAYRIFTNASLNLYISQNETLIQDHLAEYPTISLDFASRKINSTSTDFESILDLVRTDISDSFKPYQWLCAELEKRHDNEVNTTKQDQIQLMKNAINKNLTVEQIRTSIYNLSEILNEYFDNKTIMVFVDENAKLVEDFSNVNLKSKNLLAANELIGSVLTNLMKPISNTTTTHLARVFITGESRSAFDAHKNPFLKKNVQVVPFLKENAFNSYYGFNETEVTRLCDRYKITPDERKKLNEIYTGEIYPKGKSRVKIYNPFLVKKFLRNLRKPIKPTNKTRPRIPINPEVEKWLDSDGSF